MVKGRSISCNRRAQSCRRLLLCCLLAAPLLSHAGGIAIAQAWARPTPPTAAVGVVYLAITNTSSEADQLLALATPAAEKAELHETRSVQGVMQMRALDMLECPPGKTVSSEPNGVHIMLLRLNGPLRVGTTLPLTLTFRNAGAITIQVAVENRE